MSKSLQKWTNWSKSFSSFPETILFPSSVKEISALIKEAAEQKKKIKLIGSGHSCSTIAKTNEGFLVSLDKFNKVLSFDQKKLLVSVEAGIRLKDLLVYLRQNGATVSNLGTIDEQSLAGAICTGTHGTGLQFGAIDQQIVSMELITAAGETIKTSQSENPEIFKAARVSLGALGIISKITLKVEPHYNLEVNTQTVTFEGMLQNLEQIHKTDYLRFWWAPHTNKVQQWSANRTQKNCTQKNTTQEWLNGIFKGNIVHEFGLWLTSFFPLGIPKLNNFMYDLLFKKEVQQIGTAHEMFVLPILVKQSVMEYAIPLENTKAAISEMKTAIDKNFKVHMPIELRFSPKNDASLSMAYHRETCYIGIISYKPYGKNIPHDVYFKKIHDILKKYDARPHWAKKHFYDKLNLERLYPEWENFKQTKAELDPTGIFENEYLKNIFS
ncbi:D-arabinono-1,4-lactone oxidase [Flavicella sediminum]|uniref:D-arabinono-1,4-lactone oxidase n=1 Tax=Flavicella sediminum TaxID=2585141 RepID=UPI00111CC546|nr:D-arabinono-1,4-lactone oxidase [Flavicella sediminum]